MGSIVTPTMFGANGRTAVYSYSESALKPISVFDEMKKKSGTLLTADSQTILKMSHPELAPTIPVPLDFQTWLPFASGMMNISPHYSDYVIVPVPIMTSDLPNRNGVAFPLKELIRFNPEFGMQNYKTWKGKPTYYEHQNNDISKAYGVIVDCYLTKLNGWSGDKLWKVILLLAFDRLKHPELCMDILSGEMNSYSMGAWVGGYECSICNKEVGKCNHIDVKSNAMQFHEHVSGKLLCKNVVSPIGFETSAVGNPAFLSAISDKKMVFN